ncbi:hypothetical protein U9R62_02620 [Cylindrospermopsis raciborskii DSH]|uniref:hypothetical protein n=1 Tax=Cylindrospermopsis raciborskii TaxID=77022 RepID=UPI002EDB28DF
MDKSREGRGTFLAARTIRYPIGKVRYTQTLKAQGWQAQFEVIIILEISSF